eukprot:5272059-Alexandrium_andersonii.AAC.1
MADAWRWGRRWMRRWARRGPPLAGTEQASTRARRAKIHLAPQRQVPRERGARRRWARVCLPA